MQKSVIHRVLSFHVDKDQTEVRWAFQKIETPRGDKCKSDCRHENEKC